VLHLTNKAINSWATSTISSAHRIKNTAARIYKEEILEYNPGLRHVINGTPPPAEPKKRKLIVLEDD